MTRRFVWLSIGVGLSIVVGAIAWLIGHRMPIPERVQEIGTWCCSICGHQVERTLLDGAVISSGDPNDPEKDIDGGRAFEKWYLREIAIAHAHDFFPVGCHRVERATSPGLMAFCCYMEPFEAWYRALPACPDPVLARALVAKVRTLPRDERASMLRSFGEEEPWRSLAAGESVKLDGFCAQSEVWLAKHAEWR